MAVTSAMRKNSRWASYQHMPASRNASLAQTMGIRRAGPASDGARRATDHEEVELIAAFEELKREIKESHEPLDKWPVSRILAPFLELIRSPLSTGPITTAAITSLHNLLVSGLLHPDSNDIVQALTYLSHVVSHCKFETSDTSSDEIVLSKITSLVTEAIRSPLGSLFGDTEICEMLETVLTTSCHTRLSELLRRSTQTNLHTIIRVMFTRLKSLEPDVEEQKLRQEKLDDENSMAINAETGTVSDNSATPAANGGDPESIDEVDEKTPVGERLHLPDEATVKENLSALAKPVEKPAPAVVADSAPYGLPAIIELFRAIIDLLDPNSQKHTDTARLVALRALNVIVEVAGRTLQTFPSLLALVVDNGCRYLFQLARSNNPYILFTSLRTISALFETMREHLKLQQELFLSFCIERLAPPPAPPAAAGRSQFSSPAAAQQRRKGAPGSSASSVSSASGSPLLGAEEIDRPTPPAARPGVAPAKGETRDLMLDTLLLMAQEPSFMVDLWVNYDSDVNCEDLFERFVTFLSRSVYPAPSAQGGETRQQPSQFQCLETLLTFIGHMTARADGAYEEWPAAFESSDVLKSQKSSKRLLIMGASKFNVKPKDGLAFLTQHGLLGPLGENGAPTRENVAKFLKSSPRLDKKLLGDYISRSENRDLLVAYIKLFDFRGKAIADAMRELLETFRLPGEAQQISYITESFAEQYYATEPDPIKSQDAVYILAYSVLLLNTDQHNPQNRKRMTPEDYQRNLRGMNDGVDFPVEFLRAIYDSIRKREIIMPEEHLGQVGFDYAWKELLVRSQQAGSFMVCNTRLFDADMFKAVWKQVISAIAYSLSTCDDDETIQRAVGGFRQCASLAGVFQLPEVFDYIAATLSRATGLVHEDMKSLNNPVVEVEGQSVTVSTLSINFGTNIRGQLAAVVLFTVANSNANSIREGWSQIFKVFQSLFMHQLLPTRMLQMEDFLGGVSMIPLQAPAAPSRPAPRSDAGLLSTLSSYLLTPYSASTEVLVPEATEAEVESTMSTIDCINACRLDELYSNILSLELDALLAALRALQHLASERTFEQKRGDRDDIDDSPLAYDPASVFLMEMMVSIACHRTEHIEETWPIVFEHLSSLLAGAQNYSVLLIERAVVGLLRLCLIVAGKPSLRDQLYVALDVLGGLQIDVVNAVAEQIISGLVLVVRGHSNVIRSQTEWALVFSLLRVTAAHPEASKPAFDLISELIEKPGIISPENLAGFVAILDEYANIAGSVIEAQSPKARRQHTQSHASEPAVEKGLKAIDLLYALHKRAGLLLPETSAPAAQGWRRLHLPVLTALGRQSTNPCREIRHSALGHLQRAVLGQQVDDQAVVSDIFNRVVFPLIDDLLRPAVFNRDPQGMSATRAAGSALLAKVFLHYESRPTTRSIDVRVLWIQILDLFDRLMNLDRRDQLFESVPETLKNVVLVLHASEILLPPPSSGEDTRDEVQAALWAATHERIERFLPGFLDDIIVASEAGLTVPPPPMSVPSTPVVATAP
ncbi:Sec7-domain-containing protein [Auricularia subglabra TFB-10046 SS5]|nr:Sec7-domain-containing protein [Auricularia subglabra TFB-10046 SS5]